MPKREDTKDWIIANCLNCGRPYGQEEAWMEECPVCFKEKRNYNLLKGDLAFAALQYEIERLRALRVNPPPVEEDGDSDRLQDEIESMAAERDKLAADLERSEKKRQKMRLRIKELEGEVGRLLANRRAPATASPQALDPALLKKLLMLCHPDKHKDDPVATEVTRWILSERQKNQ